MLKDANQPTLALRLAVLGVLLLGQRGDGAPMDSRLPEGEGIVQYLGRVGIELDCYFTMEEKASSIRCLEIRGDEHLAGVDQLVALLNKQLKGVHAFRSTENPAVVHLVDVQLEKEKEYTLAKRVSINYSGDVQGLVDRLHSMYFDGLKSQDWHLTSAWPGSRNDCETPMTCSAHDLPVRRVLSDFMPLSQYSRILWLADSREESGKLETKVQYLQLGRHSGTMWLPVSRDPVTFVPHYLGEPRVNGLFTFDAGEVAYANNSDDLKTNPTDDLDGQAVTFIRERMQADRPAQVRWAMLFLGKRKAEAGIPTLLKYLSYQYTTCGILEESYPAVRALTMIGRPAADAAFKELLEQDESDLRVRLLTAVVRAANGYYPTRDLLEKALAAPKDDEQRKRLELALKLLEEEE